MSANLQYKQAPLTVRRKYDVIPVLVDVAQNAVKEKVIRVIVATFRVRAAPGYRPVSLMLCAELSE